ncbi:hypothetical protein H4219_003489 [Mycoemilia scoparia]|uniref:Major facilitator superfamily (MFS) profile domain-containing protein n=1 Tax=Mycoemilia scoparia TaxID=417184 RepID=A0A9W8DMS6_9FUNG|nr:hypothetical protein H4219_003489 [Mycoemilia scoparia]
MATMPRTIRDSRLWKWLSYMRNKYGRSPNAVLLMVGLALFVDTVCMGAITPGLPDLLQSKLKMDDYTNGILYGCFGIGVIFGAVTAGIISDRYLSRRAPMVVGLFGLAVTAMLFAFSNSFWKLVLARIAQGAASGITWTIGLAMVADVVPEDRLGTAMGTASIGLTLGKDEL